jgi:hypothetical protein
MDDRPPTARVARQGRRRLRLRFAERRGDDGYLNWLVVQLSALPDVTHVQAHPLTGSILILHSSDSASVLDSAAGAGQFTIAAEEHEPGPLLDREVASVAVPLAAAGILSAFAVWQLLRGRVLPPAVTLGWYAATLALPLLLAETKKE